MRTLILILLITFLFSVSAQAQDDPIAKALEQTANRLAVAEEKNRLLEDRLQAKDATILNLEGVIKVRDEQLELAKSAGKDRAGANEIDEMRISACTLQLAKADAEIYRLKNPGFLGQLFNPKTLIKVGIGYGICKATQ